MDVAGARTLLRSLALTIREVGAGGKRGGAELLPTAKALRAIAAPGLHQAHLLRHPIAQPPERVGRLENGDERDWELAR